MKRLMRTIALFLALAMALSVSALADGEEKKDDGGPRLVWRWLNWDDEGHPFADEDVLSPESGGEDSLDHQPGEDREAFGMFFVQDGGKKTPVVRKDLKASKGLVIEGLYEGQALEGDKYADYYVRMRLEDWNDGTVTYTYNRKALRFDVRAALPLEGFYTAPEATRENYLTTHDASALEDMTVYFISIRNDEEHGCHVMSAKAGGDAGMYTLEKVEDNVWKIVLNFEEGGMWVDLEIRVQDGGGNRWTEQQGWGFDLPEAPQLAVRWCEWGEHGAFIPEYNGFDRGMQIHSDGAPLLVFYTTDGWDDENNQPVNPQPVPAEELKFSEGVEVYLINRDSPDAIEEGDAMAECYVQLHVLENDQEYTVTYGEYQMNFDSHLPDLSVYSAPEATFDAWTNVAKFGPNHMDETFYILSARTYERRGCVLESMELLDVENGEDNINDLVELENVGGDVYTICLKDGADPTGREGRVRLLTTWRDENGDTWEEDGWEVWFDACTTMLASEEPILDSTKDIPNADRVQLGTVADKIFTSVTMTAGEDKTIYIARSWSGMAATKVSEWNVYASPAISYHTSDSALTLTVDSSDYTKFTLSCQEAGEYEIRFNGYSARILGEDGEPMPEAESNKLFDEFWMSSGCVSWNASLKDNAPVLFDADGEKVECPYELVCIPGDEITGWFGIKVTVEEDDTSISEIYPDITNENAWYVPAVKYVTRKGMMGGSDGKFNPNTNILGTEFVQIMYNIAGKPEAAKGAAFEGVDKQWYAPAVLWAAGDGLITDTGDTALVPTEAITREQLAVILYNAEGRPEVGEVDLSAFSDAGEISPWALDAVKWAVSNKIINGGDGKLNPTGKTPRSNVAQLLMNYYG